MPQSAYDQVVAARTRTAQLIRATPELLAQLEGKGGLAADLDVIIAAGRDAFTANALQGQAAGRSKAGDARRRGVDAAPGVRVRGGAPHRGARAARIEDPAWRAAYLAISDHHALLTSAEQRGL